MKKSFNYREHRRTRNSLPSIFQELYSTLLNDKNNWVLIQDFEYVCDDDGDKDNIYGYVFKLPLVLNGVSYLFCFANYYGLNNSFDSVKETTDKDFNNVFTQEDIPWEDYASAYLKEWVFGNKKMPHNNGGNL